ncbi:MAG: cyclic nucleotide-binding domain-containing protein [Cyanobacteria bacterium SBLK]|nr:cyclic nucleotide-binding domain-containing protein [Cyanobacteria bacterium SBLK]
MTFLSINRTIPLLIVSPILASIAVTGYLGYYNGRKAVDDLAQKINLQTTRAIEAYLQEFLSAPQNVLTFNEAYIKSADIDINDFDTLRKIFNQLVPQKARGFSYGNEQGDYIGITLDETNDRDLTLWLRNNSTVPNVHFYNIQPGKPDRFTKATPFDPRIRPWYENAKEAGKAIWSQVYAFAGSGVLGMSAATPIFDSDNIMQGVFVTDVILSDVNEFLENLYISPRGEAFIIEQNGAIVGNSLGESPFLVVDGQQERMDVRDSPHPLMRETSQSIFAKIEDGSLALEKDEYFSTVANNTRQYIGVMPVRDGRGIEWLIIVAIPETDFASVIQASVRSTLLVGGIISVLATVMGLLAAKWIINPIQSLNWAAKAIEEDRFEPATLTQVTQRQDEVGELARVFEGMGTVISASKASLKQQMSKLESQVAQAKRQNRDTRRYDSAGIRTLLERSRRLRQRPDAANNNGRNRLLEQLKQVRYFAGFSDDKLQQLIALGNRQVLEKDRVLFHEEEPGESFYLILQGSVKVYVEQLDRFLTNLSTGEFFGELSLLLGVPRTATVQALEETSLFVLDRNGLQTFLKDYPKFGSDIAKKLCEHQEELEERKELLKAAGILEDEESFNQNPLNWIRNRLFNSPISS